MIRRPIKRWTGILLRLLTAFAFMGLLFVLSGWALRPAVDRQAPLPDGETLARTESHRRMEMDLAHPPVLYREANYRQGEDASWRPKGESPLLADLVAAGKLPPVAERVGEEPLVVEGVDGIGRYGGTWVRLATDSADALNLSANRMSYAALLRFSPQGYPIVPHVAKDWEASEDHREFTFHLRKGMRWSDGHPFTADDVLYWWEQEVNDPAVTTEIPTEFRIRNESCQLIKVDDHTIRFVFPHPYGLFPTLMATHIGMRPLQSPKHYLAKYHPVTGDPDLAAQIMREFGLTNRRAVYHHVRRTDNPMIPRLWPLVYRTYREGTTQEYVRNP
ncbi:MAG: ABC transporter substrate-binding protein, partial [Kiritimatiellia bacterium]|nr:ABC transporter substrate-binding protein [Kiritimatiellia bacterium]